MKHASSRVGKAHTYLANSKDVISPLTPISKGLAPRRSELGMASLAKPAQAFQSQASMLAITNPVKRSQPLFESAKPSANRLSAIFKMKGGLKQERKNKEVASLLMEQKKQIQHMNTQLAAAARKNQHARAPSGGRKTMSKSPFRQAASKPRLTADKSTKSILDKPNLRASYTQGQFPPQRRDDKSCPSRAGAEQAELKRKKSFS